MGQVSENFGRVSKWATKKHKMSHQKTDSETELARRLGLFDATMIVMGGIIGSGIFMNPSVVALQVHTPFLILGAWLLGGLFALAAAFIWAELAARRPDVGGQYAYLREAFHPGVAFVYGWVLLLVIQTGGMAAVAVTFARYFVELTNTPIEPAYFAAIVLAASDGDQLSRRARGKHGAKHSDGVEDRCDRGVSRLRVFIRGTNRDQCRNVG